MLYPILVVFVVTIPFMDLEVFRFANRSIVLPVVVAAVLVAAVIGRPRTLGRTLLQDRALPFLLIWFAIVALASGLEFLSDQRSDILGSNLAQVASLAIMVAHYVFVAAALRSLPVDRRYALIELFVWVAAAGGVLSLYQLGAVVFGWPYAEVWRTSDLYYKANTLNWHGGGSWIAFPRAYGTAPEPTFWAGYLVVGLAVTLGLLSHVWKWSYAAAAILIAAGLVSTFSRAALPPLAAMLGLWLLILWLRRLPLALAAAMLAAAVLATVWPAFVPDGSINLWQDHSAIERLSAQITGLKMVADAPFIGTGPGSVPYLVDAYLFVVEGRQNVGFSRLYSFFLIVLVSSGLVGTVTFMAFLLEDLRMLQERLGAGDVRLAAMALSGVLAIAAIVIYWIGSPAYNMSYVWFSLALSGAVAPSPPDLR
jgi:O-antigen ligase